MPPPFLKNLAWIWGDDRAGYCRVRDWESKKKNPEVTDYIFPRGDLVWEVISRVSDESKPHADKHYTFVVNFTRKVPAEGGKLNFGSGWILTKDLMNMHPLEDLQIMLEDNSKIEAIERKLDEKSCTNGACRIQNYLRARGIKHVKEVSKASDLKDNGEEKGLIKYYRKGDNLITDLKKPFYTPGDIIILKNGDKNKFDTKNPTHHPVLGPNLINWSGHTATIAKLHRKTDSQDVEKIDLIEAHMGKAETKGTTYSIDEIHYWGVAHWGFVWTDDKSSLAQTWDKWWFYHYANYMIIKNPPNTLVGKFHDYKNWWLYNNMDPNIANAEDKDKKAEEEKKKATDLLAEECKNRNRPVKTPEQLFNAKPKEKLKNFTSYLELHGVAYWVEPESS